MGKTENLQKQKGRNKWKRSRERGELIKPTKKKTRVGWGKLIGKNLRSLPNSNKELNNHTL